MHGVDISFVINIAIYIRVSFYIGPAFVRACIADPGMG